jgi:pyrroline-5-carboxylate reductase
VAIELPFKEHCSNLRHLTDTLGCSLGTLASMKEFRSVLASRSTTVVTDCRQPYQQSLTTMRVGFIGTGTITSAIVSGLNSLGSTTFTFLLSPRNAGVAASLASAFDNVTVAASNQAVLDGCDTIMLAVRPQVAVDVLESLRFRPDHHVISLIALIPIERLQVLVAPATRVVRAIPLPMVATRAGVTAFYPDDSTARAIFNQLGSTIALESPEHFNAFSTATATMAPYFAFAGEVTDWLTRQDVPPTTARSYIGGVFHGLATVAANPSAQPFSTLAEKFATAGGINEQVMAHLTRVGALKAVSDALDGVLHRMTEVKSAG